MVAKEFVFSRKQFISIKSKNWVYPFFLYQDGFSWSGSASPQTLFHHLLFKAAKKSSFDSFLILPETTVTLEKTQSFETLYPHICSCWIRFSSAFRNKLEISSPTTLCKWQKLCFLINDESEKLKLCCCVVAEVFRSSIRLLPAATKWSSSRCKLPFFLTA